jgi:hypothetical protein
VCGSLIPIVVRGEAVPALRPAGILPAAENKGRMPSPHRDGFSGSHFAIFLHLWQSQNGIPPNHKILQNSEKTLKKFEPFGRFGSLTYWSNNL